MNVNELETKEARFIERVSEVAAFLRNEYRHRSCLLVHHNDADGIASGSILSAVFSRLDMRVSRYCLEKPFPAVLRQALTDRDEPLLVVADFGSGILSEFCRYRHPEGHILVLDHHQIESHEAAHNERLLMLNPLECGINASTRASAATVCALFAEAISPDNEDLSWLGVVGWKGDGQHPRGLNHRILATAAARGDLVIDEEQALWRGDIPLSSIIDGVNALGAFDYLRGGPDIAMKGLLSNNIAGLLHVAEAARKRYRDALGDITALAVHQHPAAPLQWFVLGEAFDDLGVKTVGLVCEELIAKGVVSQDRYLVGFQRVPNTIPGLGPVRINQIKVSMRLPPGIAQRVATGTALPLTELLPPAARLVDGFVDACHPHAAAVSINEGQEMELLEHLASLLKRKQ